MLLRANGAFEFHGGSLASGGWGGQSGFFSGHGSMVMQAGGLPDCSRWLSEARRATPPGNGGKIYRIPEGCQKSGAIRFSWQSIWHPSGMLVFIILVSGGVARRASLNHRLSSGKPPACVGRVLVGVWRRVRQNQGAVLDLGVPEVGLSWKIVMSKYTVDFLPVLRSLTC